MALLSLLLSLGAAVYAWPARQTASREAAHAWIPFRALTPAEAAVLASSAWNGQPLLRYLDLTPETVDVATKRYVLPEDAPGGEADRLPSASWESYWTVHRLNRKALEDAAKTDLSKVRLEPLTAADKISLDTRDLNSYIVGDVAIATVSLTALVLALYATRKRWWLPIVSAWALAYVIIIWQYSPAFFDADYFHQRLFVETPAPYLLVFCLYSTPVAALVTLGLAIGRARGLRRAAARRHLEKAFA